eukprot:458087-Amphidinium_carterae.1
MGESGCDLALALVRQFAQRRVVRCGGSILVSFWRSSEHYRITALYRLPSGFLITFNALPRL